MKYAANSRIEHLQALSPRYSGSHSVRHQVLARKRWERCSTRPMVSRNSMKRIFCFECTQEGLVAPGHANTRQLILHLLSGRLSLWVIRLLENICILISSRPLEDIYDALHTAPHVRRVSTKQGIQLSISTSLSGLCNIFNDTRPRPCSQTRRPV
ncbi:uncharacterized protein HD556DRAFT_81453 [Suillus plorans]|uniref:Uncharacterized protein n=1 Tax=Suillus plorans TaxID=116603 RepID=A0A9P7AD92_9AGAM|nr:uncharacterized protein HD556DRAFT_81453 [Suillus plorans]KAG1785983.1 hypothetical protein HD556DRAFT_81453 [Suillus plorans]